MALTPQAVQQVLDWLRGGQKGPPPPAAAALAAGSTTRPMGSGGTGSGMPGNPDADMLPTETWDPGPDAATGTPIGTTGGSPTTRGVEDKKPHDAPTTQLQQLENDRWEAARQLKAALEAAAKLDPAESADAYQKAQAIVTARTTAYQHAQDAVTTETNREATAKKPRAVTKQEKGPDGQTYVVTYDVDAQGNEKWNGEKPVKLDLGTDPTAGVSLETAQVNLARAQQQLANENDPLKKEQLRIQVDAARFALEQARGKAPLDQASAQLAYDRARTAYENETDPVAKETRRVALEQARVGLQQAQQNLNKPTESTQDGYLVRVAPGGELSRVDLLTPEQRRLQDEQTATKREAEARGTLPTNAYAALQQETQRLQGRAQDKLAELQARQQRGELSAEQASNQFQTWFQGNVKAPLEGLRASAEEAQRAERAQIEERNRLEDIRVQQANQQREQVGYQAGESARSALIGTFPGARSPEFAQAYGANVAAMSQRAQGRTAEERMAAPRSPGYTPQQLDASRIQAVMPSPDAIAAAARQRALAAIAPTVAVRAGFTAPALPTAPDIQGLLGRLPYTGPLSATPAPATGLLPTPGREAVDLGTMGQPGFARTYYGPNGEVWGPDWRIPG